LAIKHCSWAAWWSCSISAAVGCFSPPHAIFGHAADPGNAAIVFRYHSNRLIVVAIDLKTLLRRQPQNVSMWQLAIAATKASSGSTQAGLDHGAGTTLGEGEAATDAPPSNAQVCSREYLPFKKSGPLRCQWIVALCSDIWHASAAGDMLSKD
jgi:hypothetical protein